jgi:hypothetical protein
MTARRSRIWIGLSLLAFAAGRSPAVQADPVPAEPPKAEPANAPPANQVDEAVDLITSRPRLQALRPDNVRERLAKVVPAAGSKWKTVKPPPTWDEEAVAEAGAVQKVTATFEPAADKPADFVFREIFIELRGGDIAAQVKELAGKLQQRLGKPASGRPRGNKITDITWSLGGEWNAHLAVQPLPQGKPLTLVLYTSAIAPQKGE